MTEGIPKEWTTTWNLFDDRKTGFVSHLDLKHILRSLGRRHSEAEFYTLLTPLPDPAPFSAFLHLMHQSYQGPTEEDLLVALRAFDHNGSGALRLSELVVLLSSLGEKMPEGQVRQLLSEVPTDKEGNLNIDDLVRFLVAPVAIAPQEIGEIQKQLGLPS
ncbi:unnamed protein product [Phytomonas sp. Hart1]|nr:unnamed protein product [Phytomonas sp. Hart1]|eukprot:CCW67785.1 unnamed protein product [Phytomonas sp. isolate Hart1]